MRAEKLLWLLLQVLGCIIYNHYLFLQNITVARRMTVPPINIATEQQIRHR